MSGKQLLEEYNSMRNEDSERALWRLFKAHEERIIGLLDQNLDDERFHKLFRQADITGNSDIDMAIWYLLQAAPVFWKLFEKHKQSQC